jgi:amino acid exporter
MQPFWSILAVCGVYAISVASPGPSTVLVVRRSASRGDRAIAVATGLGTTLGSSVYATGSLFGLTVLLLHVEGVASLMKIGGGAYLLWLGLGALFSTRAQIPQSTFKSDTASVRPAAFAAFREALTVNLANPKTAVFFVSLLAPAITPDTPVWARMAMLGSIVLIDLAYFQMLALVFSRPARSADLCKSAHGYRTDGCVLTAFDLALAIEGIAESQTL